MAYVSAACALVASLLSCAHKGLCVPLLPASFVPTPSYNAKFLYLLLFSSVYVSSEDSRTQVRGQTVKQSADFRSVSHAPNDVVRKFPVRSCRGEYYQKTAEHHFVDRQ